MNNLGAESANASEGGLSRSVAAAGDGVAENVNLMLGLGGSQALLPVLSIILPIGLSFHTFQAMSYTIEVYRGAQRAEDAA